MSCLPRQFVLALTLASAYTLLGFDSQARAGYIVVEDNPRPTSLRFINGFADVQDPLVKKVIASSEGAEGGTLAEDPSTNPADPKHLGKMPSAASSPAPEANRSPNSLHTERSLPVFSFVPPTISTPEVKADPRFQGSEGQEESLHAAPYSGPNPFAQAQTRSGTEGNSTTPTTSHRGPLDQLVVLAAGSEVVLPQAIVHLRTQDTRWKPPPFASRLFRPPRTGVFALAAPACCDSVFDLSLASKEMRTCLRNIALRPMC